MFLHADERPRYRGAALPDRARAILVDPAVAYVHVRSQFNCFQVRIERT